MILQICGAYGRKTSLQDWKDGKDFRICGTSTYCSIRDMSIIKRDGFKTIELVSSNGSIVEVIEV